MFNRLPGAMLLLGHTHQWRKGLNCSRVVSQHTAPVDFAKSQPVQSGAAGGRASLPSLLRTPGCSGSGPSRGPSDEQLKNRLERGSIISRTNRVTRSTLNANRRVKAGTPDQTWQRGQRQAFTPAVILFIALPPAEDKADPG